MVEEKVFWRTVRVSRLPDAVATETRQNGNFVWRDFKLGKRQNRNTHLVKRRWVLNEIELLWFLYSRWISP